MKNNIGLVLEGGGLRGVFTSGVLDYFMDKDIYFPYIIGVSMGACNASSYISKQRGRNKIINIEFVNDKRYLDYKRLLKGQCIFGKEFIFEEIPNKIVPFDYKTFNDYKDTFIITATDCETGKAVYFDKNNCSNPIEAIRASSSLPFISPMVEIEGKKLLDGGIADSIPIQKALKDGNEKLVVVLTREMDYIKEPFKHKKIAKIFYKNYPKLIESMSNRYEVYNNTLKQIKKLEEEGKVFVIRPKNPLKVKRIEKDKEKLNSVYNIGYNTAKENCERLHKFLNC